MTPRPIEWILFISGILFLLSLDLLLLHRDDRRITPKDAALGFAFWAALALAFNYYIFRTQGSSKALEFLTGYLIEESLSIDNLFVFVMLMTYFNAPERYQHRILFWGILGAILARLSLILFGTALIARFHWILYLFGAFLIVVGVRLFFQRNEKSDPETNPILRLLRRILPMTPDYRDGYFFVREAGRLLATPLALILAMIEMSDVIFALDSIPAIFGVTRDPFIIFSSNIFAIMGLRTLYFLIAGYINYFRYLQIGLSVVMVFIGGKMLAMGFIEIPIAVSLGAVVSILAVSVALSIRASAKESASVKSAEPRLAE